MAQNNSQKGIGMPVIITIIALAIVVVGVAYYVIQQQAQEVEIVQEKTTVEKDKEAIVEKKDGETMTDEETEAMMMKAEQTGDAMMKNVDDTMMKEMMTMVYQYSGQLADVTEGKTIRGISTDGESSGIAKANFKDSAYSLLVTFENLPDPQGTDFYEGWVVRKGSQFSVISTGEVEKIDEVYTDTYLSGKDLTDHDFYVLTLEPDDGNPAPASHILEGTMTK